MDRDFSTRLGGQIFSPLENPKIPKGRLKGKDPSGLKSAVR